VQQTVYPFTVAAPLTAQQVGGKALALINMTRQGLPVPPGFVLSVPFFAPWFEILAATPEWLAVQTAAEESLSHAARTLQSLCRDLAFTPQQQTALSQAFEWLQPAHTGQLYAVRSSSPDEDLEIASFAGGYETTLGVTMEDIENAIRHSFASSFDARVFIYKKEHNFPTDQMRIAVIVQQQVDANSAGVAFSINPLNNCYDEVLINANHGLGETVVSGAVDPDVFVVDRLTRKILDTKIGANGTVSRLNPGGGTTQTQRKADAGSSLTTDQAARIAKLIDQVEACTQKPVDIEWAFAQDQLYLLQVRPITTYLPLPAEMITAPGEPKRLYANSTLIEQGLQDPLSVLGTELLGYVLTQVGGPVGKEGVGPDGITFTATGGYYMNISYALKLGMGKTALAPGSFGDPRVTAILDSIDMKQYTAGALPKKLKGLRSKMLFNMLPMAQLVLKAYLNPDETLRNYQAELPAAVRRFQTFTGDGLSLRAQAVELSALLNFFYGKYGIPMILASQIAQQRIKGLFKQEASQVQDHLINLGIALPGNKTTEMGELMYALASSDEIHRYDCAADFLADLEKEKLSPELTRRWQHFLEEFGMRCPGEIDAATVRLNEQPALFFDQIKHMALTILNSTSTRSFFEQGRAKRKTAYQALYELARQKGKNKARALEKYYKIWTTFGGYRETPKHYVIKVVELFRRQALKTGEVFTAQGRLDRPEQIFDLTMDDIDRAQADLLIDLRALARERSALIDKIRRSHLVARVIDSRGKIFYPPPQAAGDGEQRGSVLTGVPISPGLIQGRVKVFKHAADKQLLPGEILVARATDPGWTPLFINASGIILEIGGALQHGAVVAREYGIPCVSGLDDATSKLVDGQLVEVDGSNGIVRILA
jgi:rifampicin phosphotransferase